ncbi:MAG: hypothetical protein ABIP13_05355 [Tepidiformaceae bacterium]
MTKVMKMLGGSGLAAVLGVVLLGFSGAFNATTVSAESPPNPPSRFVGSVKVDGANAPAGTTIEAKIGTTTCGVASVFAAGGESRYALDSPALDPGANPNCGTDGAVVTFYIGGKLAAETGRWANYQLGTVNLTYTTPVAATVTATPATPGAGTPAAGTTPGAAANTPKPPSTGNSGNTGETAAIWLFAVLGMGALAFGVGGVTVARRSR